MPPKTKTTIKESSSSTSNNHKPTPSPKDDNSSNPFHSCPICNKEVLESQKAVTCMCNDETWYHAKCVHLTNDQYELLAKDQKQLTWVCAQCKSLSCRPDKKLVNQTNQFDEIIKILLDDINTLKEEIQSLKNEKDGLSGIVAKKTEIIYRLESTILDLTKDHHVTQHPTAKPSSPRPTQGSTQSPNSLTKNQHTTAPLDHDKNKIQTSEIENQQNLERPLIIGDSLMRQTTSILSEQNPELFPESNQIVMRGAKIQNVSRFLKNQNKLPKQVVLHIGSNNVGMSRTPNHVMRPLWLTIESNQKRFPGTEWYIGSIPYREDCRKRFIDETNKALEFMCKQLKIHFIDNTHIINETHLIWDGIHLNETGSQIQAKQIIKALNPTQNGNETPDKTATVQTPPNSKATPKPPIS